MLHAAKRSCLFIVTIQKRLYILADARRLMGGLPPTLRRTSMDYIITHLWQFD